MDLSELERLTKQNEVADVLRRARALLADPADWWCHNHRTGHCISSAVAMAHDVLGNSPIQKALCDAIGVGGLLEVFAWNDAPERTHTEVLQAFDRAIALAESAT